MLDTPTVAVFNVRHSHQVSLQCQTLPQHQSSMLDTPTVADINVRHSFSGSHQCQTLMWNSPTFHTRLDIQQHLTLMWDLIWFSNSEYPSIYPVVHTNLTGMKNTIGEMIKKSLSISCGFRNEKIVKEIQRTPAGQELGGLYFCCSFLRMGPVHKR